MDLRKIETCAKKGHEFRLTDLAAATYNKKASTDRPRSWYLKQKERMYLGGPRGPDGPKKPDSS